MLTCLLITVIYLFTRYKDRKFSTLILTLVLLGVSIPNLGINPVTSGLSSVLDNPLVKTAKEVYDKDPDARWVVFGYPGLANLLKANGIKVLNGVKFVPIMKDMEVLDPAGKYKYIYNRYAHIGMTMYIDLKDSIEFRLVANKEQNDIYNILMDPCSPKLKQLGVKYFLFSYKPQDVEIRCMVPVDTVRYYMYKRKDE